MDRQQKNAVALAVGFAVGATATVAMAALPTEATAAFTSLSGAVTDILAAAWPVIAAVVVGFVTIKLFKRGGNKV